MLHHALNSGCVLGRPDQIRALLFEITNGFNNTRKVRYEQAEIRKQTIERIYLLHIGGYLVLEQGLKLFVIRLQGPLLQLIPQELYFVYQKLTLLPINHEPSLRQPVQHH